MDQSSPGFALDTTYAYVSRKKYAESFDQIWPFFIGCEVPAARTLLARGWQVRSKFSKMAAVHI